MADPDLPNWVFPDEDASDEAEAIQFFAEDIDFELVNSKKLTSWLREVIVREGKELLELSYIFCSDEYLYHLNVEYLQHDTYTDVITFPYSDPPLVSGDIFISIDRIRENARAFEVAFEQELHRVMVHGVLHLCGYKDKTEADEKTMREKEQQYLLWWNEGAA